MINIVLLIICLLGFISTMIVGRINYKQNKQEKYSYLNQFPYELQNNSLMKYNFYYRFTLSLFFSSLMVLALFTFLFSGIIFLEKVFAIILVLNSLFTYLMMTTDMKNYKVHVLASVMVFTLTIASYLFMSYLQFRHPDNNFYQPLIYVCLVIGIILICLVFLPYLKKWMYLKKNKDANGNEVFSRGKVFFLSLIEWIFILSEVLFYILITIFKIY